MNPQDNPHFTAYALGELSAEEARALHEELATTPSAAHELEQIEAVTDALRQGAPILQSRLTHEQRYAVLHPANLPRRIQPMLPRKSPTRPVQIFWPVMGTVLKMAAVVTLSGAAFAAGWLFSPTVKSIPQGVALSTPERVENVAAVQPMLENSVATKSNPAIAAKIEPERSKSPPIVAVNAPPFQAAKEAVVAKQTPVVSVNLKPNLGFTMPVGRSLFVSTTKQAVDHFSLHPAQIKPVPPKLKGQAFASPQMGNGKLETKSVRVTDLFIHSWKAELADCPWNTANRLMRLVIQLPADQSAVLAKDLSFPLQVAFDKANVKQFRMLSERHLIAAELRSAGTYVLWYEFQPNWSGDIARDSARQIATVTLPNARFTSQTVGPFDGSKLQVFDRGYSLQNAREDFVFETAVVGFGLLLSGAEQISGLNHDLVLNLAKQAKGTDVGGERSGFIHLVQEAQHAAGL